jgi:hypothetical protein
MTTVTFEYFEPPLGWDGPPWTIETLQVVVPLTPPSGDFALLLIAELRRKDLTPSSSGLGPYPPLGWHELVEGMDWTWPGAKSIIYPAATISRSSHGSDTPPNLYIPAKMEPSINFGRGLFGPGADPSKPGGGSAAGGVIDLIDPENELDYLLDYIWDGASITIKRGKRDTHFSTWNTVAFFTGAVCFAPQTGMKTIRLRDVSWKLNSPIHNEFYRGDGGIEGEEGNKNTSKPYLLGYGGGVSPRLINTALQIYQWSFTPSQSVIKVRHQGVEISVNATYDSYAMLAAATIPAGECAICLACSSVRFNIDIVGDITLDVQGDANDFGFGAPLSRSECALRIVTSYGDHALSVVNEVDINAIETMDSDLPGEVGWFWDNPPTRVVALGEIMAGVMGGYYVRPTGQLVFWYPRDIRLDQTPQALEYKAEGMSLPVMIEKSAPHASVSMGWGRNYTTLDKNQLDETGISEPEKLRLSQESQWAKSELHHIIQLYPSAEHVQIQGNFRYEIDALAEAHRLHQFTQNEMSRWEWTMEIDQFADVLNVVFTLNGANLLDLGPSRNLLCVDVDTLAFGQVKLEWWGFA